MFQYLSVGHPPYYKGLDYIYEDRGEVKSKTCRIGLHGVALLFYVITIYLIQLWGILLGPGYAYI